MILWKKSVEKMYDILVGFIESMMDHWEIFARAAGMKKNYGNKPQFKTERWFQAEFLYCLWCKGITALPEWKTRKWDLYIPSSEPKERAYFALKDFVGSDQHVNTDYGGRSGVKKDIQAILDHDMSEGRACIVMLLPKEKSNYREGMLKLIERDFSGRLEIRLKEFDFKADPKKGIVLVWIKPLSQITASKSVER